MSSVEALLSTRQELEEAFRKDMEAIDYLLSRLGYTAPVSDHARIKSRDRSVRTPGAPVKEGSLRDWTEKAFRSNREAEWTAPSIYDWAIQQGAPFQSDRDNSIAAFGNVLRSMAKESVLVLALSGSGRRPAHYRWKGEMLDLVPKQQELTEVSS